MWGRIHNAKLNLWHDFEFWNLGQRTKNEKTHTVPENIDDCGICDWET